MNFKIATITIAACFSFAVIHAQNKMGINTATPAATLDVAGQPGDATQLDGVIPPRLTKTQLAAKTYTAAQTGAIVYITTATATGAPATVTEPGYYGYDGTTWHPLKGDNIYTADGTLNSNRTVTMSDKTLAVNSTATTGTSHFTVDGTTLNVDAVNNRVGLGVAAPAATLDVVGDVSTTTTPDGVIAPRLTRAQLINKAAVYNAAQIGAIVYVTDLSGTASAATKTANVITIGYYYFDGSDWVQIAPVMPYASIIRNGSVAADQNPNSLAATDVTKYSYAGAGVAGAPATECIVNLTTNAVQTLLGGITISGKNVVIPSAGLYEIDFIAYLIDNGAGATSYKCYIGNGTTQYIVNEMSIGDGWGGVIPTKYVGSFAAGATVDFRIASSGGQSARLMSYAITVRKISN